MSLHPPHLTEGNPWDWIRDMPLWKRLIMATISGLFLIYFFSRENPPFILFAIEISFVIIVFVMGFYWTGYDFVNWLCPSGCDLRNIVLWRR